MIDRLMTRASVRGHEARQGELQPLPAATKPFDSVTMDLIKLPDTPAGFNAAFVVVDRFSKYVIAEPCTVNSTSQDLADIFIRSVYSHFGLPASILSDRGSVFTSNYWTAFFDHLTVRLQLTTPYHPQTDGQTEVANRTLISVLRAHALTHATTWDRTLKIA